MKLKNYSLKQLKRLSILIMGITILLIGLVLLTIPGPGILTIIFGFMILATEFIWAEKLLKRLKNHTKKHFRNKK